MGCQHQAELGTSGEAARTLGGWRAFTLWAPQPDLHRSTAAHWQTSMNRLGADAAGVTPRVCWSMAPVIAPAVIRPGLHSTNKPAKSPGDEQFKDGAQYPRSSPSITTARHSVDATKRGWLDARNGNCSKSFGPPHRGDTHTIFSNGNVYISSGYGVGCKLVNVGASNRVRDVWQNKVMQTTTA